jgi:hypothetical protein
MTDLRTRIAKVLYERLMSRSAWARPWNTLYPDMQKLWLADADAVIEELGLRQEWGALDDTDSGVLYDDPTEIRLYGAETAKTRYVTEWTTDG